MRIKHWLIGLVGVFVLISFNASLSRSVYAQAAALWGICMTGVKTCFKTIPKPCHRLARRRVAWHEPQCNYFLLVFERC